MQAREGYHLCQKLCGLFCKVEVGESGLVVHERRLSGKHMEKNFM